MNKVAKRVLIWVAILGALGAAVFYVALPMCAIPYSVSNERDAVTMLKSLATAQADFRANDRDGNLIEDYWRADVAGLYVTKSQGQPIKLIELSCALADDRPTAPAGPRTMKAGYWYRAIRIAGESKPDPNKFAFCALPGEYPKLGKYTFLVSHEGRVFRKDLGSAPGIEVFPADPSKEGWEKLD
jgi:hypothetical protein